MEGMVIEIGEKLAGVLLLLGLGAILAGVLTKVVVAFLFGSRR